MEECMKKLSLIAKTCIVLLATSLSFALISCGGGDDTSRSTSGSGSGNGSNSSGDTSAITAISLSADSTTVNVGGTITITATLTPKNATETIEWTSASTEIATVEGSGMSCIVTGVKAGKAIITASSGTVKKTITIEVKIQDNFAGTKWGQSTNGIYVGGVVLTFASSGNTVSRSLSGYTVDTHTYTVVDSYTAKINDLGTFTISKNDANIAHLGSLEYMKQ